MYLGQLNVNTKCTQSLHSYVLRRTVQQCTVTAEYMLIHNPLFKWVPNTDVTKTVTTMLNHHTRA